MALVVGVVIFGGWRIHDNARSVWWSGDPHQELLGISHGGTFFNDPAAAGKGQAVVMERINRIQTKIQQENDRVAEDGGPYVKVVLLMPLTVSAGAPSAITLHQIEHALQGIYTALIRANTTTVYGDHNKLGLQLLLANQGSRQSSGERLLRKVLEVSEEEHPLVGVIGLGSSVAGTETVVRRLGAEGIPMVSAITSADTLTGLPNFWSVSPSNVQYSRALRHYLDARKSLKSAIAVYDRNPDPYTNSLFTAYQQELRTYLKFPDLSYVGATIDRVGTPNLFATVVTNLCVAVNSDDHPLDTVLYAGRGADFEHFARALKDRPCRSEPLTVLAAATGFASTTDLLPVLEQANVKVVYATSADSESWRGATAGRPGGFPEFAAAHQGHGFPPADLRDGMAIAHHDALAVLAAAARLGPAVPTPADIPPAIENLVLAYAVRGASGDLSFPKEENGRAVDRMIPIKQLGTDVVQDMPAGFTPYWVT
ncbi:ABC transporter substrate-binding protein [Nonomuraea candida]|uniref:ABC transporter substrate-binding protein n=1 Tax=Nonomuraea candida TaxID=359159 RepID=UPI0005BD70F7|nr:hypothetical protein [Nonomuraea candida]